MGRAIPPAVGRTKGTGGKWFPSCSGCGMTREQGDHGPRLLERVRRVDGARLGFSPDMLPADGKVEAALLGIKELESLESQTVLDRDLYRRMLAAPGNEIIKVAGNLAYPTGLMVSPAGVRRYGTDYGRRPVGTGPRFDLTSHSNGCASRFRNRR